MANTHRLPYHRMPRDVEAWTWLTLEAAKRRLAVTGELVYGQRGRATGKGCVDEPMPLLSLDVKDLVNKDLVNSTLSLSLRTPLIKTHLSRFFILLYSLFLHIANNESDGSSEFELQLAYVERSG